MSKCLNQFTNETMFMESFGNENATKNCEKCPNFVYEDGCLSCKKFNKEESKES